MSDLPTDEGPNEAIDDDKQLQKIRRLIASVEELRALLSPLSPDERERVLALAREIAEQPGRPSVDH